MESLLEALALAGLYWLLCRDGGLWSRFVDRLERGSDDD